MSTIQVNASPKETQENDYAQHITKDAASFVKLNQDSASYTQQSVKMMPEKDWSEELTPKNELDLDVNDLEQWEDDI